MNTSHTMFQFLPKLTVRFGILALVLTVASTACRASSLPTIAIVSGNYQSTPYGSSFAAPLLVKVTDSSTKLALSGVQVNFTAKPGIQLSASSAITNINGQASVTATSTAAGSSGVTAQVASNPAATVTFTYLTVSKAPLTVMPGNVQSIVGVIPSLHYYALSGFVNGESASTASVTGTPALATNATPTSNASTYSIMGGSGSLNSANYSFVQGRGALTLTGTPVCGNLGVNASSQLNGTYAFNLFDQQRGYTGVLTADGVSSVRGQTYYNTTSNSFPGQWNFVGNYRMGNGFRGGAALLQTPVLDPTISIVTRVCFAVDNLASGIAGSGRLIETDGYQSATAGTFYRFDGSATSIASFKGTYIVGLQGTRLDTASNNPLQYAMVAALNLDGNGNVTGSLSDVDYLQSTGDTPSEQYTAKQQVTGTYTFDSTHGTGVITLNNGGATTNFTFVAPTSQHLLVMTADAGLSPDGSTSTPIYFGEAQKQAAGPFSAASFKGNVNFVAQGIDAYSGSYTPQVAATGTSNGRPSGVVPGDTVTAGEGLVAEVGGISFDGIGTMVHQGLFTLVDGFNATVTNATNGTFTYTVDPATGRFESRDPSTHACTLCGYLTGPNTLIALAPGSGIPLFATLKAVAIAPQNLKVGYLAGNFSAGSLALTSPLAEPYEGRIAFDSMGNFSGATDTYSPVYGEVDNLSMGGTYTVSNGAYVLTMKGNSSPDFYLYMSSNGQGILVPFSPTETASVPLLVLNPVNP